AKYSARVSQPFERWDAQEYTAATISLFPEAPRMTNPDPRAHSRTLVDGPGRAPARSYLKSIGFTSNDLQKPLVMVAHEWIGTMPCNYNQRALAQRVMAGIRAAGGTLMEVNTISISDGISMGTEGMKASLISREIIADSIELAGVGYSF